MATNKYEWNEQALHTALNLYHALFLPVVFSRRILFDSVSAFPPCRRANICYSYMAFTASMTSDGVGRRLRPVAPSNNKVSVVLSSGHNLHDKYKQLSE